MARTDWTSKDTVRPADMNQIGQEINDLESSVTVWLGVTEGTDTEYTVTSNKVSSLYESLRVSFRAHQTSGINPTLQINSLGAIPLKKPNGRAAKLDTDGVYTAVYSAASFILQGEGGEYGTAGPYQVLQGYSIGTENGIVNGEIPTVESGQNLPYTSALGYIYPQITTGFWRPGMTGRIADPYFVPSSIRGDRTLFGMKGDANVVDTRITLSPAAPADIVKGKTAYVNGQFLTGTFTPGASVSRIQRGVTSIASGSSTVDVTVPLSFNPDASLLTFTYTNANLTPRSSYVAGYIKDGTTITFLISSAGTNTATIRWELIEFHGVKIKYTGTLNQSNGAATYMLPSTVDLSKTIHWASFISTDPTSGAIHNQWMTFLPDNTKFIFQGKSMATGVYNICYYQIIEFA